MLKTPKSPKLVLSKETLRKLAEKPTQREGAHPTTTVNTIKTGCC